MGTVTSARSLLFKYLSGAWGRGVYNQQRTDVAADYIGRSKEVAVLKLTQGVYAPFPIIVLTYTGGTFK